MAQNLQSNQVKRTPQDGMSELNIEPAGRFKNAAMIDGLSGNWIH